MVPDQDVPTGFGHPCHFQHGFAHGLRVGNVVHHRDAIGKIERIVLERQILAERMHRVDAGPPLLEVFEHTSKRIDAGHIVSVVTESCRKNTCATADIHDTSRCDVAPDELGALVEVVIHHMMGKAVVVGVGDRVKICLVRIEHFRGGRFGSQGHRSLRLMLVPTIDLRR